MDIDSKAGMIRLTLYSGITYDEKVTTGGKRMSERDRQMYRHDAFAREVFQIKVDGLDFSRTSEDAFKTNDRMKDLQQLHHDRDSLVQRCDSLTRQLNSDVRSFMLKKANFRYKSDSFSSLPSIPPKRSLLTASRATNPTKAPDCYAECAPCRKKQQAGRRRQADQFR